MNSWVAAYSLACVFGAAVVRGYSGFGFSLLAITSLSLVLPLSAIIPPVFMMEVAASLSLMPSIWKDVHWKALGLLWLGCALGTPLGVRFLATVPAAPMKIALAIVVLAAAALLGSGYLRKSMPSAGETLATGGVAGLLNGAFGIVAPPVVVFFFGSPAGAAISRASLVAFFVGTDSMGLGFLAREGLVTREGFYLFLMLVPMLLAGQWLGARSFKKSDPTEFRRWALRILSVLALLTGLQGGLAMAGAR
ncbi:MAG TPA: sulfite exporter TauE/SafE family protein [Stellaceae bacterium]|nr:sulfite exporter TauE/SafE family protein [Stellaceae bacterium]